MHKKIFWKFNIIDIALMVIIGLSVLALVYKATFGNDNDQLQSYSITYVCEASPVEVLDSVAPGESCVDGDYGTELGALQSVSVDKGDGGKTGKAVFVSQVDGEGSEHGVTVGDVRYLKGKRFNLIVGDAIFNVYISDIK